MSATTKSHTRREILLASSVLLAGSACRRERIPSPPVDLFVSGTAGVQTYRIPALLETPGGTLLAVADARHDSGADLPGRISLLIRKSKDGGVTWTPAETLASTEKGGVGDASLLLDANGHIWCFFAYGPPGIGFRTALPGAVTGDSVLQVHAIRSTDEGHTWSAPRDITPQFKDPSWHACFVTSGTHFVTASGRMLLPLVVLDGQKRISARNAYSDDHGETWRCGEAVGPDTDESKAVEVAPGAVLQNVRSGKRRVLARSSDGGVNFTESAPHPALIDASCNAGMARYRRGGDDLILFTNAASETRERLTIRASTDGGTTWSPGSVIHRGPAAYSTVLPLRDGSIAVLYECGDSSPYQRIRIARVSLDAAVAS